MLNRRELGAYGEKLAVDFLRRRGCRILATNFRSGRNEIDIIIETDREIAFIEVKTRSSSFYGLPEYAVDRHKLRSILACAHDWMSANDYYGPWRVDIVSVEIDRTKSTARIKQFKNLSLN